MKKAQDRQVEDGSHVLENKRTNIVVALSIGIFVLFFLSLAFFDNETYEYPENSQIKGSTINSSSTPQVTPSSPSKPILSTPTPISTPTFKGYACTQDCSGHEAGYNWAEEKGIDDPSDCGGNSNSFIEGCEAYAEEQQEEFDSYGYDEYEDY